MKAGNWYAHGKLLLTGEYLVMHGAKALAMPIRPGQSMQVRPYDSQSISWQAHHPGGMWFSASLATPGLEVTGTTDTHLAEKLRKVFLAIRELNPGLFSAHQGASINTRLEFDPDYGFGSSSTLISNLAAWARVDPYELLRLTFDGSGYDIACARSNGPLVYRLDSGTRVVKQVDFDPPYAEHLYFVYLGKKQRSSDAISDFNESAVFSPDQVRQVGRITDSILSAQSLAEFEKLLEAHELLMSAVLGQKTVKDKVFPDLDGCAKSLGAWGGDFVLISTRKSRDELKKYLDSKGLSVFYTFRELVLT